MLGDLIIVKVSICSGKFFDEMKAIVSGLIFIMTDSKVPSLVTRTGRSC